MELAQITAGQVVMLFLLMGTGIAAVKTGVLKPEGKQTLSNLLVYLVVPAMIVNSYRMEFSMEILHNLLVNPGFQRFTQCINALHGPQLHTALARWRGHGTKTCAGGCARRGIQALSQPGRTVTPAHPQPHVHSSCHKNNASNQPAHALNTAHCGQAGQSGNYYYLKRNAHICLP